MVQCHSFVRRHAVLHARQQKDAASSNIVRRYLEDSLAGDLAAGFSVAAVSVPIVFAYAGLTGLPIQSGFYAAIFAAT